MQRSKLRAGVVLALVASAAATGWLAPVEASSHRETPFITENPKVDATDF